MSQYPRGSTWRRWDLHVHTPSSIVQGYGGDTPAAWDAFINALKALPPDIQVIAVTDYLFVDGYEKLLARRHEIPNILTILANIEFRLDTFAGTANNHKRHNFHVLFDETVSVQTIRGQLLNCLSTGYRIEDKTAWQETPTRESLSALGKMMKAAAPPEKGLTAKTDLMVGFDSITYKLDDIMKNLNKTSFRGKYVLGIGYSEWDQARWDQAAAEKRSLINTAHFALISNDDIAKIEEHRADLRHNKLNDLILHSSDAHDLTRLGKTKLWIKADPTFAGLKQVINENERVFLGDAPPAYKQAHQVIDKILISDSNGWFNDGQELELNDGLVAIIGGRGSGKSALAEMVACGGYECDNSNDSFVAKATKHSSSILGARVSLFWADGAETSGEIGELIPFTDAPLKYLPQKAVEELCAPSNSDKLVSQIESVIFQALPEADRLGSSTFVELKEQLLSSYEFQKNEIIKDIKGLNAQHNQLDVLVKSVPTRKRELDVKIKELHKLKAELPKLPTQDEKAQNELAGLVQMKRVFEERIVALRKLQERVGEIQARIRVFQSTFNTFSQDLLALIKSVDIKDEAPFKLAIDFDKMQAVLQGRTAEIQGQIDQLRQGNRVQSSTILQQNSTNWTFDNYGTLSALIDTKTKETKAFETTKLKFQQQKDKIAQTEKAIDSITKEITRLETDATSQRKAAQDQRFAKYAEYFKVLEAERTEITKLYGPLQQSLDQGSDTDKRLRFEATFVYQLDDHLEKGLAILDRTKRGNFREIEALRSALSSLWDAYLHQKFTPTAIRDSLVTLWNEFTNLKIDGGPSQPITTESQLKDGYGLQDFFDWFLDPTVFTVTSSLTFDDTDLYLLSPGKKGIVLLMLYLGMDLADTRPLIIDQPEDNLDNLSVYRDLIGLFRKRKQFRQIILVTHNPNLVVNTDAEQVIIATFDGKTNPRITYSSGSLEDQAEHIPDVDVDTLTDGIIEQVCDILEGGSHAFRRRSNVYTQSPKIH